jgi:hypothetical protein
MTIDRSGDWWRGSAAADLDEYLASIRGATARRVPARCPCGGAEFRVAVDDHDDCAARTCAVCGATHVMLESDERWEEAQPEECQCPCGADRFDVAVAVAPGAGGPARVTVALRCVACGVLGVYAEWDSAAPVERLVAAV